VDGVVDPGAPEGRRGDLKDKKGRRGIGDGSGDVKGDGNEGEDGDRTDLRGEEGEKPEDHLRMTTATRNGAGRRANIPIPL